MTDLIAVIPDTFIVLGAAVFAIQSFRYSRALKTGFNARSFAIVGLSSTLLAVAELGHLAADAGVYPVGELAHDVVEAIFVIILTVGVSRFFPSWMPRPGQKQTQL